MAIVFKNTALYKAVQLSSGLLLLFILVLYVFDVPEGMQRGKNGQAAIKGLDEASRSILSIRRVISQFQFDGNAVDAKSSFERLIKLADLQVNHYENLAAYSSALSEKAMEFKKIYNQWINVEKTYIDQYSQTYYSSLDRISGHYQAIESEGMFLRAMQLLTDSEMPIHDDITRGQKAFNILQMASAPLLLYLFFVILFFWRKSLREHVTREKNLEMILRSIGDAVIATDVHGNITSMNPEAERLTGWSFADAKDCALSEIFRVVNENSGEPIDDLVERVKREGGIVVIAEDSVLIASNGNRYQIYENGAPIYNDAALIIGVVLVFRDITREHELKSCLNENALRLQRVIDSSMDAVIVTDEQGMVEEWNPAAENMFGWSYETVIKQPIHDLIIPEEFREAHLQGIQKLTSEKKTQFKAKRIESTALHRDGHTFPVELAMTSIFTGNGWVFNAFVRDLSEIKNTEELIKKHNVILRETQRIAKLGYWELDLLHGSLEWSDEIFRIFALEPATSRPSYGLFMNIIHPEDRERVDTAYSESLKNKKPYNIVHRIVTSEGIRIVHEQCETTFDDDGKPVRSLGLVQDITERVNTLDELRLASTTFQAHAGILITEKNGNIVRVNPAFEEMTGYSAAELVGMNFRDFQSDKQSKSFYKKLWSDVDRGSFWKGELWNKRKDGTLYAELLTITAVKDDTGEVTHYVGTSQDITRRKQAETEIEYLTYHDDLTGLANRRLLHDRLQQSIVTCKRHNESGAVLLLDLDQFKNINDSHGHVVGDDILRQVALRLKALVRENDTVARMGGDEFAVILSSVGDDLSSIDYKVQSIAEKIRVSLSQPYKYKDGEFYCNASIGVTLFPENSDHINGILKHAETALHRAKMQNCNQICFYQPSIQAEVDSKLTMVVELRKALVNDEFLLHFQPQFNDRGELFGAEVLLRWEHPEQGMILPGNFLSIAEDSGLILDIGRWVLEETAKQAEKWHEAGISKPGKLRLAINVSAGEFRQHDFVSQVLRIFKQADMSFDCIELEVTEALLMDNLDEVVEKMEVLSRQGVGISIDDFGTGYSSLPSLRQLPLNQLKIDQSFVRDIENDDNDAVVVETIIAMSHHLDLHVMAEGVENLEQVNLLLAGGCDAFQGYYFSQPLNVEDFSRYIKEYSVKLFPMPDINKNLH